MSETIQQPISEATTAAPTTPPKDDEVTVAASGRSWRFSKGEIVSGRDEDGTLQKRERIVGNVLRVGIYEGKTNDQYQKPYKQVEADVQTADGIIYVKAGLLDGDTFELRPSQAALNFAWGLLQFKDSIGVAMITASRGEPWVNDKGQSREASTYVNWARVDEKKVARPIFRPKADRNAPKKTSVEKWLELEEQLRAHPLFADRPADHVDEDNGPTHLTELIRECTERGWPTPQEAPTEWLGMVGKSMKQPPETTLQAVHEDTWGQIRLAINEAVKNGHLKTMPPDLIPVAKRLADEKAAAAAAAQPATAPAAAAAATTQPNAAAFGVTPASDGTSDPFADK